MTKNRLEIIDRIDHVDHVELHVKIYIGDRVLEEKIAIPWSDMVMAANGKPMYIHNLKEFVRKMAAVQSDETIQKNKPNIGDIIEA